MRKYIYILISILFLTSFSGIESDKNFLFQVWTYESSNREKVVLKSNIKFQKNEPGMEFKENGILKVKQNIGWCGTPPIRYEIVEGTWTIDKDSTLYLEYKNWNGIVSQKSKIIKLTSDELILQHLKK